MTLMVPMNLFDPVTLLNGWGPWALLGIALMVFIESGVLFPFLPGDSLLFTAGLLHQPLNLTLPVLILVAAVAAILGDQVGYFLGIKFGRKLFKPDARFLKTAYLEKAERFFAKYGGVSLVLARFVPLVRTYVPLVAGMARYRYPRFLLWNIIGGTAWATVMIVAGSLLGGVPFVRDHVDLIAVAIVALSLIPVAFSIIKGLRNRQPAPAEEAAGESA
ncbi:DedA family protein [Granulicoccus phenolivorans]|uniref:DedA family protein n=1 Tax=Granulicoccus phenolivorans TaxID=266854 RepID=UPI00047BAC88|nr:VTT domain-containing protein [Granulicoccus phenolivorans]